MAYAETTKVPISQTKAEIEKLVLRHGGTTFGTMASATMAQVLFEAHGRRLIFRLPIEPDMKLHRTQAQAEQFQRARWRALLLTIKAKFESIESGIEAFEDAFLANIVLPNGDIVADQVRPAIARSYAEERMVPLLPAPRPSSSGRQ